MGGATCTEGRGFEFRHHILDGHFSHYSVVKICIDVCLKQSENKPKRGRGRHIYIKEWVLVVSVLVVVSQGWSEWVSEWVSRWVRERGLRPEHRKSFTYSLQPHLFLIQSLSLFLSLSLSIATHTCMHTYYITHLYVHHTHAHEHTNKGLYKNACTYILAITIVRNMTTAPIKKWSYRDWSFTSSFAVISIKFTSSHVEWIKCCVQKQQQHDRDVQTFSEIILPMLKWNPWPNQ